LGCFKGKQHVQSQDTTFECLIKRSTAIADMLSLNKHRDLRNKACFITKELHNKSSINHLNKSSLFFRFFGFWAIKTFSNLKSSNSARSCQPSGAFVTVSGDSFVLFLIFWFSYTIFASYMFDLDQGKRKFYRRFAIIRLKFFLFY
jgi:hypothetical protein